MAIETKVQSSNMRPVKAGREFIEVMLKDSAPGASGTVSDAIPLGNSYRSVKAVSVAASFDAAPAAYADCMASAGIVDTGSVKLLYKANAPVTVIATFECEA